MAGAKSDLQNKSILYVGTYVSQEIEDKHDLSYSLAANNHVKGIIESFQTAGSNVAVVSPIWRESSTNVNSLPQTISDKNLGVNVHIPGSVGMQPLNSLILTLLTTLSVLFELYKSEYDCILFYNFYRETAVPALIGSVIFSTPLYVEYLDSYLNRGNKFAKVRMHILHMACGAKLAGGICVSTELENLIPVNNTVILRGFPSIGYPDNLPDRELNSSDQTVITFAGRFDSLRGIFKFIDICDSSLIRDHDIEFWICGYGPEYQTVEEIVTDLPESVKFFGTLRGESYVQRIVSSDVLVNFQDPTMPDSNHVFPSKLLDFMSAGNIILSTPVGDVAEHLDHIINITESDSENIKQNLVEIVTNRQEYEHKAKKGPMWVKENCSYMHASKQLHKLIG